MKKYLLILILFIALGLRLYRLGEPLADWHSWRQADTAAVSRNFVKRGFDLLHPRFDDLSNVPSGKLDNPEGYRFVEFPIYNLFHAIISKSFPFFSLEMWGRLLSIFFSLGSIIFLYSIVKKLISEAVALWSAFFMAVLPFNIYYGRVILPEPMMIFTGLGMIWFFINWAGEKSKIKNQKSKFQIKIQDFIYLSLATIFAIATWLLKPFALVLLLPLAYFVWKNWRFDRIKWLTFAGFVLISVLPFVWWRWWMSHFPEGIPDSAPLFNLTKIRFSGAFFWWLFEERIGKLILGGWGLILLGLGLIVKPVKKEGYFFYSWLVAILVYFTIVAGGNVQHDYYQILSIPIICVFLAKGSHFLLTAPRQYFSKLLCPTVLVFCTLFMLAFSWYQVRDFFNINNPAIVEAGKATDVLVPREAKVIAPYGGDTAFLYQTNRQGWPVGIEIEKMIKLGATYYVNVNFDTETNWVVANFCPIEKTDHYVIVDLTRKCPL